MHLSLPPIPILYFAKLGGRIYTIPTLPACLPTQPQILEEARER